MSISDTTDQIAQTVEDPYKGHADRCRPFGGYAVPVGAFSLSMSHSSSPPSAAAGCLSATRWRNVALLTGGTFKLSRLIAKDRVTSVLRAPVTTFQEDEGHGEVAEAARAPAPSALAPARRSR